jgi:hypothetical protein
MGKNGVYGGKDEGKVVPMLNYLSIYAMKTYGGVEV